MLARDRILSARGLDTVLRKMRENEERMASGKGADARQRDEAVRRGWRREFLAKGGYAAEAEAATIAASLGLPDRILGQPLHTLSGGQRRRVELARILFSDADTLLLDEPTNHLDADSIVWLRDFLKAYRGGFIVIRHDVDLVRDRGQQGLLPGRQPPAASTSTTWAGSTTCSSARPTRSAASASGPTPRRRPPPCSSQADKMRRQGDQGRRRAEHGARAPRSCWPASRTVAPADRVAKLRFPDPAPCGKTPLDGRAACRSRYGSLEIFTDVDLAIDRGSRVVVLGLNGAGKTTLLRMLAGVEQPDTGEVEPGHGLRLGYYAQEHETLDADRSGAGEHAVGRARHWPSTEVRKVLGSFLFTGDDVDKPAGVLSGGEKTRLALATLVVSGANVLLLDEPTNNLDPASREEILGALHTYTGAVVLVTHDEGAVDALQPERVILLPDGVEDLWGAGLQGSGVARLTPAVPTRPRTPLVIMPIRSFGPLIILHLRESGWYLLPHERYGPDAVVISGVTSLNPLPTTTDLPIFPANLSRHGITGPEMALADPS